MDSPGNARTHSLRAGLLTAHLTRAGGGVYTSVRQFARVLTYDPSIQVEVFGPIRPGKDISEWSPIKTHAAPLIGPAFFAFAPVLFKQMLDARLDLVHLHGLWMHTSVAALAFTRQTRRPHIISPHGMLDRWALRNSRWKKRLASSVFENLNIKTAACLHALNVAEVLAIRDHGYLGPICVIPNGVELPPPVDAPLETPWWYKSDPEVKTLLYLGRIHPKKGLANLLKAWSYLDPELRKRWRLVIAGWDENRHQVALRQLAQVLRIEATVFFPGPLFGEDKRAAFHYSDGFILPSLSEGLPMVLLEAWAYGKPVLMTAECNLPECFEAGAAVRIEPNVDSIEQGLVNFFAADDDERERIGANGRLLVSQSFSWPAIAAEMACVYRWAIGEAPRPASILMP